MVILMNESFFKGPRIKNPEWRQFEFFPDIITKSIPREIVIGIRANKNQFEKAMPIPRAVEKKRIKVNLKFHDDLGVSAYTITELRSPIVPNKDETRTIEKRDTETIFAVFEYILKSKKLKLSNSSNPP